MLIVRSTEDEGALYVETKNLDGETNLKNKCVPKDLWSKFEHMDHTIVNFEARLTFDGPNNFIYKFEGCLDMEEDTQLLTNKKHKVQVPLTNDNIALRGMSLRNTEQVLGIVVYTGHETKIQMNTTKSPYKVSKMMHATNVAIFWIFILQCVFSAIGAVYCAFWTGENADLEYLGFNLSSHQRIDTGYMVLTMMGSWILIFW